MSQDISDTFAAQLRQMRAELLAQLREQRGGHVGRADAASDAHDEQSGDWSQTEAQRDVDLALGERETAQLAAVDMALQRVASGEYGLCIDCGADIPTARLHANPTALRCIQCQSNAEQAQGSPSHPTM